MRILFLTGSPARYMAPPQLGEIQIVAGPDWPDAQSPQGQWLSIKTPVGDYNFAALLDKLPTDQQPDAVVSLVDASWRRQPRNIRCYPANNISLPPISTIKQINFATLSTTWAANHSTKSRL